MYKNIKHQLAVFSIILLLIATFFGTGIPFSEQAETVEDIGTSNVVNQLLYGFLFFVSFILLFLKRDTLIRFLLKEKILFLLALWCLISVSWSPESFVSLKRFIRFLTIILVCLTFIFYVKSEEDLLKYFKYFFYTYLILSLLVVVLIPQAKDPAFNTWRGFASQKNGLGQAGIISSIVSYIVVRYSKKSFEKLFGYLMLLISIILIVGAFSSTAYTVLALLIFLWLIFSIDLIFEPLGIRRIFSFSVVLSLIVLMVMIFVWIPETQELFPEIFGKDSSFSGRTELWEYIYTEAMKHPLHGTGYQGYWIVTTLQFSSIYDVFIWLPNQAHNGYLDVFNELGIVGIVLLALLVVSSFFNYFKVSKPYLWILFIFVPLITNLSESSFFRPGSSMNLMFIFSYLHLQYTALKEASSVDS